MYLPAVTPEELRARNIPMVKHGYSQEHTDQILARAADTIDSLYRQVSELNRTVGELRADTGGVEVALPVAAETDRALREWLVGIDPLELEQHISAAIAEALVESTVAARRIRQEAVSRTQQFADQIWTMAAELHEMVIKARGSVEGMNALPAALHQWQGKFESQLSTGFSHLQLPWGTQVSAVAHLLERMPKPRS